MKTPTTVKMIKQLITLLLSIALLGCNQRASTSQSTKEQSADLHREKKSICHIDWTAHHHPVDIRAKHICDSLKNAGIDTLLIYRHWLGVNGFNGYGKVIWLDKGVEKQYQINFQNYGDYYGIKSVIYSVIKVDSLFDFYFEQHLDTVSTNPEYPQGTGGGHDAEHFVYFDIDSEVYCFSIRGIIVRFNKEHPRSLIVRRLMMDDQLKMGFWNR